MKKKVPSDTDSARPSGKQGGKDTKDDVDGDASGATLREAPKFDRKAWDEAAKRKVPPASLPEVPLEVAAAKTVIGAEVPAELRERPAKARSEKIPDKAVQDQATVLKAPAFVADEPEQAIKDQATVLKAPAFVADKAVPVKDQATVIKDLSAEESDAALEGADGAPTTPLVLEPAVITAPVKAATTTAPVMPAATPPGKPTAIVEAFKPPTTPLTPEQRATRIRLILAGAAVVLVIALFIPGILKSRKPSIEALQEAYKSTFRDPHLANPRADMIKFEFVKSGPCATHPEDSCLLYDLTGPKYSSQIAVFKGADGWVLERHGIEK